MSKDYESSYDSWDSKGISKNVSEEVMSFGKVFGDDDREQVTDVQIPPYNAIWRLHIIIGGIAYGGTGYMIKPGVLLTAGHNIYSRKSGEFTNVYAIDREGGKHEVYGLYVPKEFERFNTAEYDWAVIKIATDPGKTYSCIDIINMDNPIVPSVLENDAEIAGFPVKVRDVTTKAMYKEAGKLIGYDNNTKTLKYKIDTSGGNSGSPVIVYVETKPYAIGIHVKATGTNAGENGYNFARAIDDKIVEVIKKFAGEV